MNTVRILCALYVHYMHTICVLDLINAAIIMHCNASVHSIRVCAL
jgi:hypothetical protein